MASTLQLILPGTVKLTDDIKKLLEYTDLVLLDVKHIDDKKCQELTGVSNKLGLEFAKYLSQNNIPIWIRQVIIPGITDAPKDLLKLKEFIASLKTVQKIELSPYHEMGKFKWEKLGHTYELGGISPATGEDILKAREILGI